jgi:hypothetical protein
MSCLLPPDILPPHEPNIPHLDPDTRSRLTVLGTNTIESGGWGATTHMVSPAKCPIESWRRADLARSTAKPRRPDPPLQQRPGPVRHLFFAMP